MNESDMQFLDSLDAMDRRTVSEIQAAVIEALGSLVPVGGGVVVIKSLHVQVNYASGGGATVNAKAR